MTTEETEITFIRCPSCRSLVPSVATRCRMCGHQFQKADGAAAQPVDDSREKRSRIRQRTISVTRGEGDQLNVSASPPADFESASPDPAIPFRDHYSSGVEEPETPKAKPEVQSEIVEERQTFSPPVETERPEPLRSPRPLSGNSPISFRADKPERHVEKHEEDEGDFDDENEEDTGSEVEEHDDGEDHQISSAPGGSEEPRRKRRRRRRRKKKGPGAALGADLQPDSSGNHEAISHSDRPPVLGFRPREEKPRNEGHGSEVQTPRYDISNPTVDRVTERVPDRISGFRDQAADSVAARPEVVQEDLAILAASNFDQEVELEPVSQSQVETIPADFEIADVEELQVKGAAMETPSHSAAHSGSHQNAGSASAGHQAAAGDGTLVGWLVSFGGDRRGSAIEIRSGRFFVGRQRLRSTDLILSDETVSTPHCLVNASPGEGLMVQDLMSERGTSVRKSGSPNFTNCGEPVKLQHGDWIRFGNFEVMVCLIPSQGRNGQ